MIIYKATNKINGKSYIGITNNFEKRKKEHKNSAKRKDGYYFQKAINLYGWENFEWEILKEIDNQNELLLEEIRYINEYDSHYLKNGYNLTLGGEGHYGHTHSEETRKILSDKAKLRPLTENRIQTLKNNAKNMKGCPRSEEIKKRISESNKGKIFSMEHRKKIGENTKKQTFFQTEEYKEKMRLSCSGKKRTPEQKERYRLAALNRTPEHKEAIRLAKLKKRE